MITTMTTLGWPAGLGMPASGRVRGVLRHLAAVPGIPAGTGRPSTLVPTCVQGTAVRGYRHLDDARVTVTGAFPGTSAWSPPT